MATVIDVSSALGEYMLKGWILTDIICKTCCKVPLMRSPTSSNTYFCANCHGSPVTQPSTSGPLSQQSNSSSLESTSQAASRQSTPPTEVSSTLSSPVFAPPTDLAEVTRRRQQSDLASAEIGKRLLQGWAMLADECPNVDCYGIPLIRPPKRSGEQDPRKECVICHTTYIDRPSGYGLERVTSTQPALTGTSPVPVDVVRSYRTVTAELPLLTPPVGPRSAVQPYASPMMSAANIPTERNSKQNPDHDSALDVLATTVEALERSLHVLTERLQYLSNGYTADPALIGQTADAIAQVSQALIKVKELQWSERQASAP